MDATVGRSAAAAEERSRSNGSRRLTTAELLAVGSELTTGETRDSNASDLARSLGEHGVRVGRIVELPDDRAAVAGAFRDALGRADLVVATGGLGPTPDDLTREAIADAIGETPAVDPELEAWVRGLWSRRHIPFPESNLKQAWLVPSSRAIANDHGTAPGWWVETADDRLVVALPGPPREMHPMWADVVLPRLVERGLGRPSLVRTLRLAGIGESQAADLIGRELLAAPNPDVATFARPDGIDVRIIAFGDSDSEAARLAADAESRVREAVGGHVWAQGPARWAEALDALLEARDLRLVLRETGTKGALVTLLGTMDRLVGASLTVEDDVEPDRDDLPADVVELRLRVDATGRGDLESVVDVEGAGIRAHERATAFLGDEQGRIRAAVVAAWALLRALRDGPSDTGRSP